jgi:uncharacterized protein (TIGR03084 family)
VDINDMLADLAAESADVDRLVAELPPADWGRDTPAAGWTIAHQIAHLAWTDEQCVRAVTDPNGFTTDLAKALQEPLSFVDNGAREYLAEPEALLARWRAGRAQLAEALGTVPSGVKVPWYGSAMSATSMATARIMETWAHGLDIADTLGISRVPTARLRHIAYLGHRTFAHSFLTHGRPVPPVPVRVTLDAPDGSQWTLGPADADDAVTGPALDFCLLITQRRHRRDLALTASGRYADEWLDIAQAFAGPPGPGRTPTVALP